MLIVITQLLCSTLLDKGTCSSCETEYHSLCCTSEYALLCCAAEHQNIIHLAVHWKMFYFTAPLYCAAKHHVPLCSATENVLLCCAAEPQNITHLYSMYTRICYTLHFALQQNILHAIPLYCTTGYDSLCMLCITSYLPKHYENDSRAAIIYWVEQCE